MNDIRIKLGLAIYEFIKEVKSGNNECQYYYYDDYELKQLLDQEFFTALRDYYLTENKDYYPEERIIITKK